MSEIPDTDIRRLRRLVSETDPETSTYTDAMLVDYIERSEGVIYWAAAEICREKSACRGEMAEARRALQGARREEERRKHRTGQMAA